MNMADRSMEPPSESTSPKLAAASNDIELDSDDGGFHSQEQGSDMDSGLEEHGHENGDAPQIPTGEQSSEGMLPRDVPQRNPYYDPVDERQMTQTDAKLFYQQRQREYKDLLHLTPQGSPSLSPSAGDNLSSTYQTQIPSLTSHPYANLGTSASSISLHSGASKFPDIGTSSTNVGSGVAPRTATRPSLGGLESGSLPSSEAPHEKKEASGPVQPDMGLPDGGPVDIGSGFEDNDPHITAELKTIFNNIQKILDIRHRYIRLSLQRDGDNPKDDPSWDIYPPPPEPAWVGPHTAYFTHAHNTATNSLSNSTVLPPRQDTQRTTETSNMSGSEPDHKKVIKKRKSDRDIGEDFDMKHVLPLPGATEFTFRLDENGVYQVYENTQADKANTPVVNVPTIKDFYIDLEDILTTSSDGPSKSFAFRRLQYLEGKFNLYVLLNEYQETAESKKVPHRDFYNVRKVDTHVHHSACMNQKHLLRFIKSKMKKCPDEEVLIRDGKVLTLAEVFESINLTAYDLSIDTLDMHAHTDSFHRFDKFNLKYNPVGESRLRTIFLKTDNHIEGRYLAEITKEVIYDLESSKYQMVEWRISIYGRSIDEWDKLAAWVVDNKLMSHNVRWLIQIPRLYDVYKATGLMQSFEEVIKNVFLPLFEVTKNPESHSKLHIFLQRVIGFDSVDDESKVERRLFKKFPVPSEWTSKQNPPYSYWIYYVFANMTSLNFWRRQRGFNTFLLRPHCGEAGDSEHLAVALLCSHSISHGLLLRKVPLLQYIFYLEQIGIAMSPLSNNALFLAYERNPFHQYFKRGLNVSLSTDDPLQFAFTKEPLIEEYAVAAQIYKLSPVDMCELAKNSVKQSGYEHSIKQQWLGPNFSLPGKEGNMMIKTNVPDRREEFRHHTWVEEHRMISRYTSAEREEVAQSPVALEHLSLAHPGPASPTSSSKTNLASNVTLFDSKSHHHAHSAQEARLPPSSRRQQLPPQAEPSLLSAAPHTSPSSSTSILHAPLSGSPVLAAAAAGPWPPSDGTHLSGHEPRYFPGMMTRASRKDNIRKGSMHESDDAGSVRSAPKRSGAREEFS
ncbi:uncharacterized protein BCR38DRAFT_402331 [Pseudomassariella vexata]|uniref:AMP deaminase n=1 Tax=Pseudomassariella vexata TaxID=1141098 RepID=A0A1Y2DBN4_9PEZI|nr:uncharacterized protein BCR38DRAFT_402331 [Pseudomassariella vexata]ORY56669.1 hypothetical protein BCR38DRAFT_402331 [Pseudomassariella vexata]